MSHNKITSARIARIASKVLRSRNASKAEKSAAASALSQRHRSKR